MGRGRVYSAEGVYLEGIMRAIAVLVVMCGVTFGQDVPQEDLSAVKFGLSGSRDPNGLTIDGWIASFNKARSHKTKWDAIEAVMQTHRQYKSKTPSLDKIRVMGAVAIKDKNRDVVYIGSMLLSEAGDTSSALAAMQQIESGAGSDLLIQVVHRFGNDSCITRLEKSIAKTDHSVSVVLAISAIGQRGDKDSAKKSLERIQKKSPALSDAIDRELDILDR